MLAGEGLLDHAPNRGFAVRSFSLDEIGDAFEVRALNEGLACRLAAERGLTLAQDDTIREVLGRGDRLLSGTVDLVECRRGYAEINTQFHATLLEAAGSRLIVDVLKLCNRVPQTTTHNVMAFNLDDVRQRHTEHHAIYKAVALREPQSAQAQMREHTPPCEELFGEIGACRTHRIGASWRVALSRGRRFRFLDFAPAADRQFGVTK